LVTTRQQTNDPCPHRPAAAAQNAQIGVATSLIALQPTSVQIGVRAQHATQQSCSPGCLEQRIALRIDRRKVLLGPYKRLP
jgi:hypothetical protein